MDNMNVNVFLLCHNEERLIEHAIRHYRTLLPRCTITILDNMSTDRSVEIARRHRCNMRTFRTNNRMDENTMRHLRNHCWKASVGRWVIIADMDEWICVNEQDLREEEMRGNTILTIKGYNMVGDSQDVNLRDINLHALHHGYHYAPEDKRICFRVGPIQDMQFSHGCHTCQPVGVVRYSSKQYVLKHMDWIGLPYKLDKQRLRFERSAADRQRGMNHHYGVSADALRAEYHAIQQSKEDLSELVAGYRV